MLRTGSVHNKHSIADDYFHRDLNLRQSRKGQLLIGNQVEQKGTRQIKGRTCRSRCLEKGMEVKGTVHAEKCGQVLVHTEDAWILC